MTDRTTTSGARADAHADDIALLWDCIADVRFAMVTTQASDGLRSRPLTTQNDKTAHGHELYFFVEADSEVMQQVQAHPQVNVAYADPKRDRWVSVAGQAAQRDDRPLVRALWTTMAQAWFEGPDDPRLALLAVRMTGAEIWDVRDGKLTQLAKMASAALTGGRPDLDTEHRELKL